MRQQKDATSFFAPALRAGRDRGDVFMQIFNADGGEVGKTAMARALWLPILQGRVPEPVIETGGTLQAQMPANRCP